MTFRLDRDGGAEVLKELAATAISDLANQIASSAGPDAQVAMHVTDRAKATVSVPAELQARDGVLTRAASAAGLEVKARKQRDPVSDVPVKSATESGDANEAWVAARRERRAQRRAGR